MSNRDRPPGVGDGARLVVVGEVSGVFGVRGWVRVRSYTEPRDNILSFSPWYLGGSGGAVPYRLIGGERHSKGIVAQVAGCEDRDAAAALMGQSIAVRRDQLPPPAEDEFYWADLEGLRVVNREGRDLGEVAYLVSTGANDVLVVQGERERLIPFVWEEVIEEVAFDAGLIRVDWDADF